MIKTGILGGETMAAGELIRILINHPDVDLRAVASEVHAGRQVEDVHRGLTGDLSMQFVDDLTPDGLDVVMLCGEPWMARRWMERYDDICRRDEIRVVDLTGAFRGGEMEMIYGFPEYNRKALVRGAMRTSLPSPVAMAVETALFPLAKNMLLYGDITARLVIASTENFENSSQGAAAQGAFPFADVAVSTRLDPVAPIDHRPDADKASSEIRGVIREIQPSFSGAVKLTISRDNTASRGIKADVEVPCGTSVGELSRLFEEAYEDHNFTYLIAREPSVLDVANTNKCLISIAYADQSGQGCSAPGVKITTVTDNLMKGAAGNAVHCLILLFGLSERTGLAMKASAF